jgi:hypothetical protein
MKLRCWKFSPQRSQSCAEDEVKYSFSASSTYAAVELFSFFFDQAERSRPEAVPV